ncbi:MAG: cysteine desulfurase [Rhodomicrobium sp.]|nr:MAG: cysteine desulfurase [Rhodomicrobium sp.]
MSGLIYLDYNASAPLLTEAKDAMVSAMSFFGNASSVHRQGRAVRQAIEEARESVAALVGARPQDVIFTSGGTEANNLALSPGLFAKPLQAQARLYVSAIEHPAVLNGMRFNKAQITVIPVTSEGVIDLDWLTHELLTNELDESGDNEALLPGSRPILVSVMAANNETGIKQPIEAIAGIVHKAGGLLHSDCVQALGKMPLDLKSLGADLISLSAHKIGGPQGAGALVLRDEAVVLREPMVAGGGQELKRRGGTENLIGIVGFGAAAAVLAHRMTDDLSRVAELRNSLEAGIKEISPEAVVFGAGADRLASVCCFAVPGFSAETQVIQFDLMDICISSGSACSSGKVEQSHVLKAMGVDDDLSFAALRLSLGAETSQGDVDAFLEGWRAIYERAKKNGRAA